MKSLRIAVLTAMGAVCVVGTVAHGQELNTLHGFNGTNGSFPQAAVVQGIDGNFYGTTEMGGTYSNGTVFQVTPQGTLTMLYQFVGPDGRFPEASLVQGIDSNFYGTTPNGGAVTNIANCEFGCGTVFRITPTGSLTSLYSFEGFPADGQYPIAGLVRGIDSNFYGTTQNGGTNNFGTLFKISAAGSITTFYQFSGSDGSYPIASLVRGIDSNFYGTTQNGGTNDMGTVFRVTSVGSLTTLWQFSGPDGTTPEAALVLGIDSNFYGTTFGGGTNNQGTVFRITSAGSLTTLHLFTGPDGARPNSALVQGTDGDFYGAGGGGGTNTYGTLFRMTSAGSLTTLWQFSGSDGAYPAGALIQGMDGNFYGTTSAGGPGTCCGTVFELIAPQLCSISGALGVCQGDTTTLTAAPGMISYLWNNSATNQSITVGPGPYSVTQVDSNGLTNTCSVVVTNIASELTLSSCPVNTTSNTAVGQCGATVTWSAPTAVNNCGTVSVSCSPSSDTLFAQGTTVVTCTADDGQGHTTNCSFNVTVTQPAVCGITFSGSPGGLTICQGGSVILTAANGMKSYLWSGPEQNGATVRTIVVSTAGTYYCTQQQYYGSTNCCSVTVVVNPPPNATITGNPIITNGLPTTLVGPSGLASEYWTGPQNNGLGSQSNTVIDPGIYTLHVTDSNGCQNTGSVTVLNQTPAPCSITASGDSGDLTICQGGSTILTGANGMSSYLWNGPEQSGATAKSIRVGTQGTYTVQQIDGAGLTNSCSVFLTVHSMPTFNISGIKTICQGTNTTLSGPPGMSQYLWLGPQNNGFEGQSNTVSFPGTYTLTVTDSNGCQNAVSVPVTTIICP